MADKNIQVKEKQPVTTEGEPTQAGVTFLPDVDIYEKEDALYLLADMPGVEKDDIVIDLDNNLLTISGSPKIDVNEGERLVFQEFEVGRYYRQFRLSNVIDQAKIEASLKNGVLKLVLPKAEAAKPRRIEISTG